MTKTRDVGLICGNAWKRHKIWTKLLYNTNRKSYYLSNIVRCSPFSCWKLFSVSEYDASGFFCGFPFSGVTRISDAQGVVMASRDFVAIAEFVEVDPKSEVTVVAH